MTTDEIKLQALAILNVLDFGIIPIEHDQPLSEFLDSLEMVELVMECEKHFKITITNEEMEAIGTFNQLLELIENKKS